MSDDDAAEWLPPKTRAFLGDSALPADEDVDAGIEEFLASLEPAGGNPQTETRDRTNFGRAFWTLWKTRAFLGQSPPTRTEVVDAIRANGVPPEMGPLVAEWLTEKPTSRRGRPRLTKEERAVRWTRAYHLAMLVRLLQAGYKLEGQSRPRDRALEEVAARKGMEPDTLRKMLLPLKRVGPKFYRLPAVEDVCRYLAETGITTRELHALVDEQIEWIEEIRGEEKGAD